MVQSAVMEWIIILFTIKHRVGGCPTDSATVWPTVLEAKDKSEYICNFLFVKDRNLPIF